MQNKKKILIFSLVYYPDFIGGAEIAIKEITDRAKDDFEFHMITLRISKKLPHAEKIGNIHIHRIGFAKENPRPEELVRMPMYLLKVMYPVLAAFKALSLHRKHHFGAMWSVMTYMAFPAVFFKWLHPKMPLLLTIQDGDTVEHITGRFRIRAVGPLLRRIFKVSTVIQTISHYLSGFARDMGATCPVVVIPNGVDVSKFTKDYSENEIQDIKTKLSKNEGDIFLVTTSRLVPKNAVEDIIEALPLLPENIKLQIAGTGYLEESLRNQAQMLGVSDRVNFLGWLSHDEMPKYLKACDVFIRTPLSEGFGNSFVEAMASGLPVIATPVGGIGDFLKDGETGLFAAVRNPESIAKAVMTVVKNQELASKIRRNAFEMVKEKYDWAIVAEEMKRVFNGLV